MINNIPTLISINLSSLSLRERDVAKRQGEGGCESSWFPARPHPALAWCFALSGSRFARASLSRREREIDSGLHPI